MGLNLLGTRTLIGNDVVFNDVKKEFSDITCATNDDLSTSEQGDKGAGEYQFKLSEKASLPTSSASILDFSVIKTVDFYFEHFLLSGIRVFEDRLSHFAVVSIHFLKVLFHHSLVMNAP